MTSDPFQAFKAMQRENWKTFAPLAMTTTPSAAKLVHFAGVRPNQRVLDVGCGTGVVAITARRAGAVVTGFDLTPELLAVAKENAAIAELDDITWKQGDVESLPFRDGEFDVVLSQFAHIFAPRPEVAIKEMLRVLKSGGRIAFNTWPPELFIGRMFALTASYMPPPDPKPAPPHQWGDPNIVVQRLGTAVRDVTFDRGRSWLSVGVRVMASTTSIPDTTRPKTGCFRSSPRLSTTLMKNWLPPVFGPAFAMESVPLALRLFAGSSSLIVYPGPPNPVPSGSPP